MKATVSTKIQIKNLRGLQSQVRDARQIFATGTQIVDSSPLHDDTKLVSHLYLKRISLRQSDNIIQIANPEMFSLKSTGAKPYRAAIYFALANTTEPVLTK